MTAAPPPTLPAGLSAAGLPAGLSATLPAGLSATSAAGLSAGLSATSAGVGPVS